MVRRKWHRAASIVFLAVLVSIGCTKKKFGANLARISRASYVDLNQNALIDLGDAISVTFTESVVLNLPGPTDLLFSLPVSGDQFGASSSVGQLQPGTEFIEITLGAGPFLTFPLAFDPAQIGPGSPSGLQIRSTMPADAIERVSDGQDVSTTAVAVDIEGAVGSPLQVLQATFQDLGTPGLVDDGDLIRVRFSEGVLYSGAGPFPFALPVVGDTFGAAATVTQPMLGSPELLITLAGGPILTPDGIFSGASTNPNDPSGIDLAPGLPLGTIQDSLTQTVDASPAPPGVDVGGMLLIPPPFIISSVFADIDNDGLAGLDDEITVLFDRPILVSVGATPDQIFNLLAAGDDLGVLAGFVGPTTGTAALTVRLGIGALIDPAGVFDPLNPGAGPSGIDVFPGLALVQDASGVSAEPLTPAGLDIGGVVGPKISRVHFQDMNSNQTVDAGDRIVVFFHSRVDINDNVPGNVFRFLVSGDLFGTGAQFPGGVGPQGALSAAIDLGSSPTISPNGAFDPFRTAAGDPSGLGLVPGAAVVLSGTTQSALPRVPAGADVQGSLPGLVGPGPWRPTGNDLTAGRFAHTVTVLQDGKLLVVGGGEATGTLSSIEIFDPSAGVAGQGEFTLSPVSLLRPREAHTATRIGGSDRVLDTPDDVVVVIGGFELVPGTVVGHGTIEIIDPDSNDDGVTGDIQVISFPGLNDYTRYSVAGFPEPASIFWHEAVYAPGASVDVPGIPSPQDNVGRQIFTIGGAAIVQNPGASFVLLQGYEFVVVTVDPDGDGNYVDSLVTMYDDPISGAGMRMARYNRVRNSATLIPGLDGSLGTADDEIFVYGGFGLDRDDPGFQFRTLGSGEIIHGLGFGQSPNFEVVIENDFYPNAPQTLGGTPGVDPTPRDSHFATLLGDGTVLIAHGTNQDDTVPFFPGNDLTSAYEIFTPDYGNRPASAFAIDPGAVTPVPPAGVAAESLLWPGVSRLPGAGRVLIAGGLDFPNSADPLDPDPTFKAEDVMAIPFPPIGMHTSNDMSAARGTPLIFNFPESRFPLVIAPGIDLILGTADDRAIAIGGMIDNLFNPTATADFYIP